MPELEPTWKRALSIWWLFVWRGIVGAVLLGGVIGAFYGVLAFILGLPENVMTGIGGGVGMVIGVIWSIFVMRMALRKQYRHFRLAVLAR